MKTKKVVIEMPMREYLIKVLCSKFRHFGGGVQNPLNPISIALANQPPRFSAGVDIGCVVDTILEEINNEQDIKQIL